MQFSIILQKNSYIAISYNLPSKNFTYVTTFNVLAMYINILIDIVKLTYVWCNVYKIYISQAYNMKFIYKYLCGMYTYVYDIHNIVLGVGNWNRLYWNFWILSNAYILSNDRLYIHFSIRCKMYINLKVFKWQS